MKKYAIVGPEHVGKTTLAYQIAANILTNRKGVRVHVLPEITLMKPGHTLDSWELQYSFIFSQLSTELELRAFEDEARAPDILIMDRTVIDCLMYLIEIAPINAFLDKTIDLCREHMNTFDKILYIKEPLFAYDDTVTINKELIDDRDIFIQTTLRGVRTEVVDMYNLYCERKSKGSRLINHISTILYSDFMYDR